MSAMSHFADRLTERIASCGAGLCVGIDPVLERLPGSLTEALAQFDEADEGAAAAAIGRFAEGVCQAVASRAAAVKFQSACFERYGAAGIAALHQAIGVAKNAGLIVLLDAKRGDIGLTAEHYAAATIGRPAIDALTVNGYMGPDTLAPFVDAAASRGKGLFVLVRTSNPGADALQTLTLDDGRTVADAMADLVAEAGAGSIGQCGYSHVGAVVGATRPQTLAALRKRMPQQWLLLPGVGAQGGSVAELRDAFDEDGLGALVTASRSVIYAYAGTDAGDWTQPVADAAAELHDQMRAMIQ